MKKMTRRALARNVMAASSAGVLLSRIPALAQRPQAATSAAPAAPPIPEAEWHGYSGELNASRYVPADQINASNFNKLEVAWTVKTDSFGGRPDPSFQATPVMAKGKVYCTVGARRDVVAMDAETGEILWMHREDEGERRGARGGTGHGVSYWSDGNAERVIYVTPGYRMLSLDARTGAPDPKFGDSGVVDLRVNDDQEMDLLTADIGLHSTPIIANGVIVVGAAHAGGGNPRSQKNIKGYVRGYDAATGKRLWVFHTIPQKGEFGYDSWIVAGQAETAGNAGVWAQMSADEQLGLVYIGVELPTGDEVGIYRQGNALFGESVVALDIRTGKRRWHYQLVHHGIWDSDIPCAAILCDVPVDGRMRKMIAQPSKQGFVYVLDRETGVPIWPIEEKPVAKGDVPGEWYAPTQPIPTKPPAFERQGVLEEDLVDFTPEIKKRALEIASHYKLGPLYTPPVWARPGTPGPWATLYLPGFQGGVNWPGGSYDPDTHILYLYSKTVMDATGIGPNANKSSDFEISQAFFGQTSGTQDGAAAFGGGGNRRNIPVNNTLEGPILPGQLTVAGLPLNKPPYGRITAIDLSKGTILWQVAHGETPDAIRNHPLLKGLKIPRTGQSGILGPLTTKTLVMCGDSGTFTDETGRKAARLRAYDKATGEEKGAVVIPAPQTGAAMTYVHKGRQYIVTAIGSPGYGAALMAFRLPAA